MDRFDAYLDLLSQEEDYLDRLLDLAREKREAILQTAGDRIVLISNSEDSILDVVETLRKRRRAAIADIYERAGRMSAGRPNHRGRVRQILLEEAPPYARSILSESFSRYETKLLNLRREVKINNTLLSDRLRLIHHTIETVLSTVKPKEEYEQVARKENRSKGKATASTPSLLVDRKV